MNDVAISLSDLRKLWRQATTAWAWNSSSDLFRGYVREEIARRTIASQEQRIAQLEAENSRLTIWYLNFYKQMCDAQVAAGRLEAELAEAKKPMRVVVQPDFVIDLGDDTSSAGNAADSEAR